MTNQIDTPLTDEAELIRENGGDISDIFKVMRQLERELNEALDKIITMALTNIDLTASLHREEKDAARYRWLRERAPLDDITVQCSNSSLASGLCHLSGEDADAAIDAAMEKRS